MTSPDDPELRIRDLEPAPVELGQYPGGPAYPGQTPPSPAGTDRRWMSNLLLALGLVIILGAAGAYFVFGRQPEAGTPVPEPRSGPSPTAATRPPTSRTQVLVPTPEIPVPPQIPTAPSQDSGDISGIEENRTVSCDGDTVSVSGISNTVVITGHCERLTVSGIENIVTVDAADVIEVSGLNNRVTYHAGAPQVDATDTNSVEQG